MATLRRIDPFSAMKMAFCVYAMIGFVVGAILSLISLIGGFALLSSGEEGVEGMIGILFGVGAIIILPIFYGILGTIAGLIGSLIYNMAASFTGGLEVDIE